MSTHCAIVVAIILAAIALCISAEPKIEEENEEADQTFVGHDFEDLDEFDDFDREKREIAYYDEMYEPMISQRRSWMARQASGCIPRRSWCRFRENQCCKGLSCTKFKTDREMYLSYFHCL